jgi:uncharacterized membrane protein YbhN (UPF0104 family)
LNLHILTTQKSKLISIIKISASFCLLLFIVILYLYNREQIQSTLKNINSSWFFAGLLCYLFNYTARAHRITKLCPQSLNIFPEALKISSLHGFLSYILPMRAGDFSLPFLLSSIANVPLTQGNKIFIKTRLADFFGLGVLLTVSSIVPNSIQNNYLRVIFFCFGLIMFLFPFLGMHILNLRGVKNLWIFRKIFGIGHFKHISLAEGMITINVWFWTGCTSFCVIKAIGLQLSPFDAWFLAAVQLPLQLLPIQGVANSGTHEAGWVMGLTLLGIPSDHTLTSAIATHVLLLAYISALGAFSLLLPNRKISRHDQ